MDRGRYSGRSLIKSPPQPHMCIQDSLVGSVEPCFVNVLSWEKILLPAHPSDVIPLFGGMKIKNLSLNSLSCTDLYDGIKDGRQPLIFAVCTNTTILKQNGKTAQDPNERAAFICVILDFIEAMNVDVKFQHNFKILPDRDVVGELKDIWFIIQSKRDQERIELSSGESSEKGRHKDATNGQWYYRNGGAGERRLVVTKDFTLDQQTAKLLNMSHSITSKGAKEISDFFSNASGTKSKQVAGGKGFPLSYNFQSPTMKEAISWSKQSYPSSQVAGTNYDSSPPPHSLKNVSLKPSPPSFNETIKMKSREEKSAAMNRRNKTETVGPKHHARNEDKILFPSFPSFECRSGSDICKHCFATGYSTPSKECLHCVSAGDAMSNTEREQNSYESELEMCNQLWQGITTEFLPSLDLERRSVASRREARQWSRKSNLVKESPKTDTTEVSSNAALGDVPDDVLDAQVFNLVKELAAFDSLGVAADGFDSNGLAIPDTNNTAPTDCGALAVTADSLGVNTLAIADANNPAQTDCSSQANISPNNSDDNCQGEGITIEYVLDSFKEPSNFNQNIPSLSAVFENQMNAHLADEANRNVDNSVHPNSSDASQNIDQQFTVKVQKHNNNENVNA